MNNSKLYNVTHLNNNNNHSAQNMIKNLSNLIFTIKMTKDEYNEFMKIKEK